MKQIKMKRLCLKNEKEMSYLEKTVMTVQE